MKIRFLLHNAYGAGGGVLRVTFDLARELSKRHDVEIVSAVRQTEESVVPFPRNVRVRALTDLRPRPPWRDPVGYLNRNALSEPTDLVSQLDHRHGLHSRYTDMRLRWFLRRTRSGYLIGMQPGMNLAIAEHGHRSAILVVQDHLPYKGRSPELRAAYREHAHRLDLFLTLTKRDARRARRELGDRVVVRAMSNPAAPYEGPLSDQRSNVVVAVGRLSRIKGFDRLIEAWADVVREHPDWSLRIYGEGEERLALQRQIDELGVTESVSLMGYVRDLPRQISAASLFVLSSRREGYPMAMLEALSCGLPVVSFKCPNGPEELIGGSEGGVLVPNGDVPALAAAVKEMIAAGREERLRRGEAARVRALEHSPEEVARRWERQLRNAGLRRARSEGPRTRRGRRELVHAAAVVGSQGAGWALSRVRGRRSRSRSDGARKRPSGPADG